MRMISTANELRIFKKPMEKQILRDMMSAYIPDDITKAKKQGFSSPDASWFKGESIDFVKSKIMDDRAPIYSFLDASTIEKISERHFLERE